MEENNKKLKEILCMLCGLEPKKCEGHSIMTPTSNRFTSDSKFVNECAFEYTPSDTVK